MEWRVTGLRFKDKQSWSDIYKNERLIGKIWTNTAAKLL